jgi:hypothetical protein
MLTRIIELLKTLYGNYFVGDTDRQNIEKFEYSGSPLITDISQDVTELKFNTENGHLIYYLYQREACFSKEAKQIMNTGFFQFRGFPDKYQISIPEKHQNKYFLAAYVFGSQWINDAYEIYQNFVVDRKPISNDETLRNLKLLYEVMIHETAAFFALRSPSEKHKNDAFRNLYEYCYNQMTYHDIWCIIQHSPNDFKYVWHGNYFEYTMHDNDHIPLPYIIARLISQFGPGHLDMMFANIIELLDIMSKIRDNCHFVKIYMMYVLFMLCPGWTDYPINYAYHILSRPDIYQSYDEHRFCWAQLGINVEHVLCNTRGRLRWKTIINLPFDESWLIANKYGYGKIDIWLCSRRIAAVNIPCVSLKEYHLYQNWKKRIYEYIVEKAKTDPRVNTASLQSSLEKFIESSPRIDYGYMKLKLIKLIFLIRNTGPPFLWNVPNEIIFLLVNHVFLDSDPS